jgi:hypothetical protein
VAVRDYAPPFRGDYSDHNTHALVLDIDPIDEHLPNPRIRRKGRSLCGMRRSDSVIWTGWDLGAGGEIRGNTQNSNADCEKQRGRKHKPTARVFHRASPVRFVPVFLGKGLVEFSIAKLSQ